MRREAVEAQPVPAFEYPPHLLPVEIDSIPPKWVEEEVQKELAAGGDNEPHYENNDTLPVLFGEASEQFHHWTRIPHLFPTESSDGKQSHTEVKVYKKIKVAAESEEDINPLKMRELFGKFQCKGGTLANEMADVLAFISTQAGKVADNSYLWELLSNREELHPQGKYCVRLFIRGSWSSVIIDDRIPCNADNLPLLPYLETSFKKLRRRIKRVYIWPLLICKAVLAAQRHNGMGLGMDTNTGRGMDMLSMMSGWTVALSSSSAVVSGSVAKVCVFNGRMYGLAASTDYEKNILLKAPPQRLEDVCMSQDEFFEHCRTKQLYSFDIVDVESKQCKTISCTWDDTSLPMSKIRVLLQCDHAEPAPDDPTKGEEDAAEEPAVNNEPPEFCDVIIEVHAIATQSNEVHNGDMRRLAEDRHDESGQDEKIAVDDDEIKGSVTGQTSKNPSTTPLSFSVSQYDYDQNMYTTLAQSGSCCALHLRIRRGFAHTIWLNPRTPNVGLDTVPGDVGYICRVFHEEEDVVNAVSDKEDEAANAWWNHTLTHANEKAQEQGHTGTISTCCSIMSGSYEGCAADATWMPVCRVEFDVGSEDTSDFVHVGMALNVPKEIARRTRIELIQHETKSKKSVFLHETALQKLAKDNRYSVLAYCVCRDFDSIPKGRWQLRLISSSSLVNTNSVALEPRLMYQSEYEPNYRRILFREELTVAAQTNCSIVVEVSDVSVKIVCSIRETSQEDGVAEGQILGRKLGVGAVAYSNVELSPDKKTIVQCVLDEHSATHEELQNLTWRLMLFPGDGISVDKNMDHSTRVQALTDEWCSDDANRTEAAAAEYTRVMKEQGESIRTATPSRTVNSCGGNAHFVDDEHGQQCAARQENFNRFHEKSFEELHNARDTQTTCMNQSRSQEMERLQEASQQYTNTRDEHWKRREAYREEHESFDGLLKALDDLLQTEINPDDMEKQQQIIEAISKLNSSRHAGDVDDTADANAAPGTDAVAIPEWKLGAQLVLALEQVWTMRMMRLQRVFEEMLGKDVLNDADLQALTEVLQQCHDVGDNSDDSQDTTVASVGKMTADLIRLEAEVRGFIWRHNCRELLSLWAMPETERDKAKLQAAFETESLKGWDVDKFVPISLFETLVATKAWLDAPEPDTTEAEQ